jgi:predicted RNA binding protein YcfA (HicA-like mRNA interferase family)
MAGGLNVWNAVTMIYRHPNRPGAIVVAGGGKLNRDVPKGIENAIRRQAAFK